MPFKKTSVFIFIISFALALLLYIQISWLVKAAREKETIYKEKVQMVLAKTSRELCADKQTFHNMQKCKIHGGESECKVRLGKSELVKIDSLLHYYMKLYNLHIDYSFEVIQPSHEHHKEQAANNVFRTRIEEMANRSGLELRLILPERGYFIWEEMGSMFVISVLLILLVFALFWRTTLVLILEKRISEHSTDFLNNMTHEFKTPLTNISLAGKMLVKDGNIQLPEKIKHYSGIILEENEKLRLQVEQVLSMTALERGEIPLVKSELNLHHLIENAIHCISVQIENKNGHLKMDLGARQCLILGDKTHLTNTLCNLIDNAVKYAEQVPDIHLRTYNRDQRIVIEIQDNGSGIPKEYSQKVFEKFFRVPKGDVHNVKGFGLGLAYVKKIVEMHGGKISLLSELGKGSLFTLEIPYISHD